MSVKVDKSVWNQLKKDLKKLDDVQLSIGWFPENQYGSDNNNLPMAYVAALNEFGHVNGSDAAIPGAITPPRPFMRAGFIPALKAGANKKDFQFVIEQALKGKSPLVAMQQIAPNLEKTLKKIMEGWSTPPNAPLTVELKGFNDPLKRSGELIDSVTAKVEKK
ncbi:hypothetical protein D3C85_1175340 [compost metagenome]